MKHAGLRYRALVDVKTVPGLDKIEQTNGTIRIGALATHRSLEFSPLLREKVPSLAALEARVANPRVRATGTLGGNLVFAEPHSDPATLLLAMEAKLNIVGPNGARSLGMDEFIVGAYDVSLNEGELLESVDVPVTGANQAATYQKFQVHERPMLGLALVLDFEGGDIAAGRVAIGSASPAPLRSANAESLLKGSVASVAGRLDEAADALADESELLDDLEGSAEYKRHLIHVFLSQTFHNLTNGRGAR
jgi:carbon-monoxide dehydrogenase medium subunit